MNKTELIIALRDFANRLELSAVPEEVRAVVDVRFHNVATRECLTPIVKLMARPELNYKTGTHWVDDGRGDLRVTAFYEAGLLGPTKTKRMREVLVEKNPEAALQEMLKSEPAHC